MKSDLENVLEVEDVWKAYSGVWALKHFSFQLRKGEIHALVGENGAGKLTFIKAISGAISFEKGRVRIGKQNFQKLSPRSAKKHGVYTVYQEDDLIPQASVAENLFFELPDEDGGFFISYSKLYKKARAYLSSLDIAVDPKETFENLSLANQQFVKIARAFLFAPQVLILDEPTAMFNDLESQAILKLVRRQVTENKGSVVFISHHLEEVLEWSDRITVIRDGEKVICHEGGTVKGLSVKDLASEMVGRDAQLFRKSSQREIGVDHFKVCDLKLTSKSPSISFSIRRGEILGVAGLVGSGRTEMARAIISAFRPFQRQLMLGKKKLNPKNPAEAIESGIALLTENYREDGLCGCETVAHNITLPILKRWSGGFISRSQERKSVQELVGQLRIKCNSIDQEVDFLSGGNKQKTVLAKWILQDPEVLILDEPTHAVDINTKFEIYQVVQALAKKGKCILLISSEMPELISLSDRVLVFRKGQAVATLEGAEITEKNLISHFH